MNRMVFLYGRVSTDQQSTGLEAQTRALTDYCRLNSIENFELFTDENQSGTKASRPALDRMMARVKTYEQKRPKSRKHIGMLTFAPDIWIIISAISALERDLIAERVKNGLANARAKGKLIGRKKLRDSDLIRKLLKAGMSYRNISMVAKCSHGSVSAERAAMKKEEAARLAHIESIKLAEEKLLADSATGATKFPEAA